MHRKEKEKTVEELHKLFSEAKGLYLADFTGIDIQMIDELRGKFRENKVAYRVVKNTLTRRSIEGLGYDALFDHLVGPTAVAYSNEDPVAPGKLINEFYKKNEKLALKAAVIDGEVYDNEMASKIVKLPPKEQLIASLLGTLNSPITGLVCVFSGLLRNLVNVLDQVKELKENQGDAPAAPEAKPAEEAKETDVKAEEAAEPEKTEVSPEKPAEAGSEEPEKKEEADEKASEDKSGSNEE